MKTIIFLFLLTSLFTGSCKKDSDNNITVKDVDGNAYHTVTIGTQVWMVENLRTTKYNDGTEIPLVTSNSEWSNLSTPGYCWYNNDTTASESEYGLLYNWMAVNTGKLAPAGWHVATDTEWTTLTSFLGDENIAADKLKEKGTSHWQSPNTGANNESGFSALPGGYRHRNGTFSDMEISGNWWSSTETNSTSAWFRGMGYNLSDVARASFDKKFGFTVRCVKN